MKIDQYPTASGLAGDHLFLLDGPWGTQNVKALELYYKLGNIVGGDRGLGAWNAAVRRNIFRGAFLGESITSAQWDAIRNGNFNEMFLGDFWKLNGVQYRIADFDYWLCVGSGDHYCLTHHVVLIPDTSMTAAIPMFTEQDTSAGYPESNIFKNILPTVDATLKSTFGEDHLLVHSEIFATGYTDGIPTGGRWFHDVISVIPNNIMIYGTRTFTNLANLGTNQIPYAYTVDKTQLALYRSSTVEINRYRQSYWLRDIISKTRCEICEGDGYADASLVTANHRVRPVFAIC